MLAPVTPRYAPPAPTAGTGLRQVATGCAISTSYGTGNKQFMSRSPHYARDKIISLRIGIANWSCDGLSSPYEKLPGASATVTASIEYPAGTFTQVLFSASATGTIANGATLISDAVAVSIPKGQRFWVRIFWNSTAGTPYMGRQLDQENGAGFTYAASGMADLTMSGTVGATSPSGTMYAPALILANTSVPSFFLLGDSRVFGNTDPAYGVGGDFGILARSIGPLYPYVNCGLSNDQLVNFLPNSPRRVALAAYCSHVIMELGMADIRSSRTFAQVQADTISARALFPSTTPVFLATHEPVTTSSDGWATTAGQTPESSNPNRILINNWRRSVPSGFAGCLDLADAIESGRDSGKWAVVNPNSGAALAITGDGIHANLAGNLMAKNAGVINPAALA